MGARGRESDGRREEAKDGEGGKEAKRETRDIGRNEAVKVGERGKRETRDMGRDEAAEVVQYR